MERFEVSKRKVDGSPIDCLHAFLTNVIRVPARLPTWIVSNQNTPRYMSSLLNEIHSAKYIELSSLIWLDIQCSSEDSSEISLEVFMTPW